MSRVNQRVDNKQNTTQLLFEEDKIPHLNANSLESMPIEPATTNIVLNTEFINLRSSFTANVTQRQVPPQVVRGDNSSNLSKRLEQSLESTRNYQNLVKHTEAINGKNQHHDRYSTEYKRDMMHTQATKRPSYHNIRHPYPKSK